MSLINNIFTRYNRDLIKEIEISRLSPVDYQINWFNKLTWSGADTAFGKEHNLVRYTMLEFIASRKWEELDRIENSGDIAGYDNTELL